MNSGFKDKDIFLQNSWKWKCGLPEMNTDLEDLGSLMRTERCVQFEELRMNRKILGSFRYGKMGNPDKPTYDYVSRIISDAKKYSDPESEDYGNDELLVDIANHAELEFADGNHPKKHLKSSDDADHHVNVK